MDNLDIQPRSTGFPQGGSNAGQAQKVFNALVHVLLPTLLLLLLLIIIVPPAVVVLLVHLVGGVAGLAAALRVQQGVRVLVVELVQRLSHEQGGGVRLLKLGQQVVQV